MKSEALEYKDGDVTLRGYLAYDERKRGKRPGILVMPEAFGARRPRQGPRRSAGRGSATWPWRAIRTATVSS